MMRRLEMMFLGFAVCSCITAIGCSEARPTKETGTRAEAEETWELPGIIGFMPSMHVSPTGNHILFHASFQNSRRSSEFAIMDTNSGKTSTILSLCETGGKEILHAGTGRDEFSKDGKFMLINNQPRFPGGSPVTKINLKTGQATELLDTPCPYRRIGWWFGDDVAVSTVDRSEDGKAHPVRIISSEGTAIRTLPVYGEIIAADRNGKFFVVLADPDDPSQPITNKALNTVEQAVWVNAEGKKLRALGRVTYSGYSPLMPVFLSPNGAYMAFPILASHEDANEGKTIINIISMLDGSQRSARGGWPIGVTDRGELLTRWNNTTVSDDLANALTRSNESGIAAALLEVFADCATPSDCVRLVDGIARTIISVVSLFHCRGLFHAVILGHFFSHFHFAVIWSLCCLSFNICFNFWFLFGSDFVIRDISIAI